MEKPDAPKNSLTLPSEQAPAVTTLGHMAIYRYRPKVLYITVPARSGVWL
jgi:hypothetical protein